MPTLNVTVAHQLSQAEATERLKKKRTEIKEQSTYTVTDLKETWTTPDSLDFSFKILGFSLTGTVESQESSVKISVALPAAALMMKGTIESQVRRELEQVLGNSG
ncbi:MAG: polyhydroxyalkanoic acid system family protein [Planctomycetaceae bacterium]|nr:polyhydroxyalkanoic acid system family protein [Planctomycetaceae bacterium]